MSLLFLAGVRQKLRRKNPLEMAELSVCQVRTAANAMIGALSLSPRDRGERLRRAAALLRYTRRRHAAAAECHRRQTLSRLRKLGIVVTKLHSCQIE